MTREQKIEAFTMRLDGYTLEEIGNRFGITKEAVRSMFSRITTESGIVKKQYVYPNIAKWMIENNLNQIHFAKALGCSTNTVSSWLTGKKNPSYRFINLVLSETGMTFEEAFKREDTNEKTDP